MTEETDALYVESDFFLALIKEDDWLGESAEAFYDAHESSLWTHRDTLIELMMVAYREGWNVERVLVNAKALVSIRGHVGPILAAASHVEENDFTPFDALHLVHAGNGPIVSTDDSYDGFAERVSLESPPEE